MCIYIYTYNELMVACIAGEDHAIDFCCARPSSGNTYADVEAAYDYLVAQGIPPKRHPPPVESQVEVLHSSYMVISPNLLINHHFPL